MIDPKEFREGNLFKWSDLASMGFGKSVITRNNHYDYSALRDPVPLTEEWLLKSGFKIDRKNKTVKIYSNNDGVKYAFAAKDVSDAELTKPLIFIYNGKIKHVHQLQNLIFALTGKELTINTKDSLK